MKKFQLRLVVCTVILCLLFGLAAWAQEAEGEGDPLDAGRVVLYIDGIEENTDAQIAEYKPQFDGQDVKLSIEGEYAESLRFLKAMDFGSLDLYWKFSDLFLPSEESGNTRNLSGVKNLKALTMIDSRYGYYAENDVFPDLEHLTLLCSGEPGLFGFLFERMMPALRSITVYMEDASSLFSAVQDYRIFPSTVETIDILENGETAPDEAFASSVFKGSLLYCCPNVLVNGKPAAQLELMQDGDLSPEEQVQLVKANTAIIATLDGAFNGALPVSQDLPRVEGKLLLADLAKYGNEYYLYDRSYGPFEIGWTYMEEETPEEAAAIYGSDSFITSWVPREIPAEMLASGLDDADTMVIIFEDEVRLRDRNLFDTCVLIKDLRSGTIYAPYSVFPSIEETGEFDVSLATRQVMQSYGGTVAQAQIGRARFSGSSAIAGSESLGDDLVADVVLVLNDQAYTNTLQALDGGEVITQGTVSDAARGLQQMLVGFGCDIAIDGSAGPGTFAALHSVQESFGMEPSEAVDADVYRQLLPMLLISTNYEQAEQILLNEYTTEEEAERLQYLHACALYAQGRYYRAREAFQYCFYEDSQERFNACIQPWPQNGELYHHPYYYSQAMYLNFNVNTSDDTKGSFFEVYSENGDLAAALFITGSGTVSTALPGGNYRIKESTGHDEWYGLKDAFGPSGYYSDMLFYEFDWDDTLTSLPSGYEWTISINSTTGGGTGVGSQSSSWDSR